MKRRTKFALILTALLVGFLSPHVVAQPQTSGAVKRVGKRMMCLCGCNQILVECNHVGCSVSAEMIHKLERRVAANEPDDLIVQAFIQEYGQRVMAEPPTSGFNLAAWAMPLFAVLVGTVIVGVVLVRLRKPLPAPAGDSAVRRVSPEALRRLRSQADRESGE